MRGYYVFVDLNLSVSVKYAIYISEKSASFNLTQASDEENQGEKSDKDDVDLQSI